MNIRVMNEVIRGYYLETDPGPIAMVIRVELFIHKPSKTEAAVA